MYIARHNPAKIDINSVDKALQVDSHYLLGSVTLSLSLTISNGRLIVIHNLWLLLLLLLLTAC